MPYLECFSKLISSETLPTSGSSRQSRKGRQQGCLAGGLRFSSPATVNVAARSKARCSGRVRSSVHVQSARGDRFFAHRHSRAHLAQRASAVELMAQAMDLDPLAAWVGTVPNCWRTEDVLNLAELAGVRRGVRHVTLIGRFAEGSERQEPRADSLRRRVRAVAGGLAELRGESSSSVCLLGARTGPQVFASSVWRACMTAGREEAQAIVTFTEQAACAAFILHAGRYRPPVGSRCLLVARQAQRAGAKARAINVPARRAPQQEGEPPAQRPRLDLPPPPKPPPAPKTPPPAPRTPPAAPRTPPAAPTAKHKAPPWRRPTPPPGPPPGWQPPAGWQPMAEQPRPEQPAPASETPPTRPPPRRGAHPLGPRIQPPTAPPSPGPPTEGRPGDPPTAGLAATAPQALGPTPAVSTEAAGPPLRGEQGPHGVPPVDAGQLPFIPGVPEVIGQEMPTWTGQLIALWGAVFQLQEEVRALRHELGAPTSPPE